MSRARQELLDPAFLARLERLEFNVRKLKSGERRGDVTVARRGFGTLFREHRPYTVGDDLRSLDWNAYLRLGELFVKEFEAEEAPRVLLLIDRSASMGLENERKFLAALRVSAALGAVALTRHTTVAVAFFPRAADVPAFRGRGSLSRFLDHLASATCEGETEILPAFTQACPAGRPTGVAMVVSDFFETESHAAALRFLRHRGFAVQALHMVEKKDLEVRAGDLVTLVDAETGRRVRERIDRRAAELYRTTLQAHYRAIEQACIAYQVVYHKVDVDTPIERVILDLLQRRALAS